MKEIYSNFTRVFAWLGLILFAFAMIGCGLTTVLWRFYINGGYYCRNCNLGRDLFAIGCVMICFSTPVLLWSLAYSNYRSSRKHKQKRKRKNDELEDDFSS